MGVTGDLLPRILRTAGRKIDLSTYKHGVIDYSREDNTRKRTSSRRKIRIALDVGTMVARATHGLGGELLDERHCSNYGRSLLHAEANAPPEKADSDQRQAMTSDENKREHVDKCVGYVLKRIRTLQTEAGADLLVVFDGATPPIKDKECGERSTKRKEAARERDEPLEADEAAGDNTRRRVRAARRAGAGKHHGDILVEVMQALRKEKIPFMVAPYEADGQLAYLSRAGLVDLVVTEDSDLIAHGCDSIMYKTAEGLGKGAAEGVLVQRGDLGAMGLLQKSVALVDFSEVMLAVMFVAMGCDYCSSLRQIGSVTAQEIVRSAFHGGKDVPEAERERPALEKVFEGLFRQTSEKNLSDDFKKEYEKSFLEALLMYRHPIVYDPFMGKCIFLRNPPLCSDPELVDHEPYKRLCSDKRRREQILGTCHDPKVSTRIAEGWISPRTKRPYGNIEMPTAAREALLSLSASDDTDGDEDEGRMQTQEAAKPATKSPPESATKGPETQDAFRAESQLSSPLLTQSSVAGVDDPHTQDVEPAQRQFKTPPRLIQNVENTKSCNINDKPVHLYDAIFESDRLGLVLNRDHSVKDFNNPSLVPDSVMIGDKMVAVCGIKIEEGTSLENIQEIFTKKHPRRPISVSFARKVKGRSADDAIAIGGIEGDSTQPDNAVDLSQTSPHPGSSNKPSQSPLTGSSASRLGSQPSQSASSQVSAGVNSPDLLASQPS